MQPLPSRVLSALGLVLILVLAAPAAADPAEPMVVVVAPAEDASETPWDPLRHAIAAHLSPYGVDVQLQRDGEHPIPQLAADLALIQDVVAVAWLDLDTRRLHLRIPELWDGVRVRDAPASEDGWTADCQAISAIVLSELEPVLAGMLGSPTRSEETVEGTPESSDVDGPSVPTEALAATVEAPPRPAPPAFSIVIGAAYLPVVIAPEAPYLNGLGLGAGALIGRHLEIGAAIDLLQPALLDTEDGAGRLDRVTVRGTVAGWLPLDPVEFGLALGFVVENGRVRDLGYEPVDVSATDPRVSGSFTAALRFRVRVLPWLAPFVEGGADFYVSRLVVVDGETELVRRTPVQPRFAVGIAWVIPFR